MMHLLNQSVTVQRRASGTDDYGQPSGAWTTNATTQGRIARNKTSETTGETQAVVSTQTVFLPVGTDIKATDRLIIESVTYNVEGQPYDAHGHHLEVQIKRVGDS